MIVDIQSLQRSWNCPRCQNELGELNGYCEYCKYEDETIVYNPDKYFIREIRISHITDGAKTVTPQEELFAQLFNHEKLLVKDMDTLTLRAHREELAKIAFEARARLTAVDDEDNGRKKKANSDGKPKGFSRSVNTDETTTNAINTVKERQKRMTAAEKVQASLEKLGISTADAEKLMSAGTILAKIKGKGDKAEEIIKGNEIRSPLSQENGFVLVTPKVEAPKAIFNPFAKKDEA